MKKFLLVILMSITVLALTACGDDTPTKTDPDPVTYTVTFDSNNCLSVIDSQEVATGSTATLPTATVNTGFDFAHWYITDTAVTYNYSSVITADLELKAHCTVSEAEITDADLIAEDVAHVLLNMFKEDNLLALKRTGFVNRSYITWTVDSEYISQEGIVLPLPDGVADTTAVISATFKINDTIITETFDVPLTGAADVVIDNMVSVPFENLTTEYEVSDGNVDLYFTENGSVPYIALTDFFELLDGFIDPLTVFTIDTTDGILTISYQYYSEEEDITYDMILTVDSTENTVVVNDPSFYSAYVYSTETNYGRHIEYDFDNPASSFDEGDDVIYDLDEYNMDIVLYNGEVLLPYYMTNQLFAGSSYYNIYYNIDGLFGIYSLPDSDSEELETILTSSVNGSDIPVDLLLHTFNMLAFDLDYLYGLKDIMEVDSYFDLLKDQIDSLLVTDPQAFDEGLANLLLKEIDEPHTSYGYQSYFNSIYYEGPSVSSLNDYGSRFKGWYNDGLVATSNAISAKWGSTITGWDSNRPNYWFLDDTTVMLSLDGFDTADIEVSSVFDITLPEKVLEVDDASSIIPTITQGNKFWYYNNSTEEDTILEILVKGVTASYLVDYKAALVSAGYVLVLETSDDTSKTSGYYSISLPAEGETTVEYMVQVEFDVDLDVFYVSVVVGVPTLYEDEWVLYVDVEGIVESDSAVFLELQLDKILIEKPLLEDIILDLSWNTGGNIGALYRVVGFITDNPFQVSSIDRDTNGSSTYFVDIDEGIPSYASYNWALLSTPTTFSAANELVTIFQANDLGPVLGITSGGGACSITPILLPNGTAFTMSSNNISAYRTGSDTVEDPYVFHNTEFGLTPDHILDISNIYDATVILAILD